MVLFKESKPTILLRSDCGCTFAIKKHANLTKVVSIYEVLDRLGLSITVINGFRVQVVSSYMHRELSILYKEHESLLPRDSIVSIFLILELTIYPNIILLF